MKISKEKNKEKKSQKRIEKYYTEEYQEHLIKIDRAQEKFQKNPCRETATKLSNLKNNEFKKYDEVFKESYIEKLVKEEKKRLKELDEVMERYTAHIKYEGNYGHIAKELIITGIKE